MKILLVAGLIIGFYFLLGAVIGFINDYRDYRDYMHDEDDQ